MNKDLFFKLLEKLNRNSHFSDFEIIKSSPVSLIKEQNGLKQIIQFRRWCEAGIYTIEPTYIVKFNILHDWWAQFVPSPNSVLKNGATVAFTGRDFQLTRTGKTMNQWYDFELNDSTDVDDNEHYQFINDVYNLSLHVFEQYNTLESVYNKRIAPVLAGEKELPSGGYTWLFETLTLCKLVAPDKYQEFKTIVLNWIDQCINCEHPNLSILEIYPWLPDIINYFENTDISTVKSTRKNAIAKAIIAKRKEKMIV